MTLEEFTNLVKLSLTRMEDDTDPTEEQEAEEWTELLLDRMMVDADDS